jgi:hypothetical protein
MSDILLAEGFGNLSNGTHTAGTTREILGAQWTGYTENFAIEDRGDGRKWIKGAGTRPDIQSKTFAAQSTVRLAFTVYRGSTAQANVAYLFAGSTFLCSVGIRSDGAVALSSIWHGNTYDKCVGPVVPLDTITHIEMEILLSTDAGVGTAKYWVNGVYDAEYAGATAVSAGSCDNLRLFSWLSGTHSSYFASTWKFCDFIVHTATSPLGAPGVYYLPADSDGTDTDFTPSTGTDHFAMVDEIGPDENTTYNESDGTSLHRDSYLTAGISGLTILSVSPLIRARKTDTGTSSIKVGLRHSATEGQGAAIGLSEDYLTYLEWMDTNPSTSAAWAAAAIAATEATVEVQ